MAEGRNRIVSGPTTAILDSSVWVCYLRPHGWEELKTEVRRSLEEGRVATCRPVIAELLIGARDDQAFGHLRDLLQTLPRVSTSENVWEDAAQLGQSMRLKGVGIPLPDLLISQAAIRSGLILWHVDAHYERVRRFSSLHTRSFLPEGTQQDS